MCGIFGFINPHDRGNWDADKIIPQLLFVGQTRGRDAVGMFGIHKQRKDFVDYCKLVGPADHFLNWSESHDRFIKKAEHFRFMVGHNRAATIGRADDPKAVHPHRTQNITLVHNGTLRNYPNEKKYVSDSAAIAAMLEMEPDFLEVEKKINGAWALVWHDKRDDSLNFVRNGERPLVMAEDNLDMTWFASEGGMLRWILERNNKQVKKMWSLEVRKWVKYLPDGEVREVDVPFVVGATGTKKTNTSSGSEKNTEAVEIGRANETILGGESAVLSWKACKVEAAHVPKRKDVPRLPAPSASSAATTPVVEAGKKDDKGIIHQLQEWAGNKVGDQVWFFPVHFSAMADKGDRVKAEGPMMVYGEKGTVHWLDGVEVCSRVKESDELSKETVMGLMHHLCQKNVVYTAQITALTYDVKRKRVRVYAKNAVAEEWFDFDSFQTTNDAANKAWRAPYPLAASEVAALEKKQ